MAVIQRPTASVTAPLVDNLTRFIAAVSFATPTTFQQPLKAPAFPLTTHLPVSLLLAKEAGGGCEKNGMNLDINAFTRLV